MYVREELMTWPVANYQETVRPNLRSGDLLFASGNFLFSRFSMSWIVFLLTGLVLALPVWAQEGTITIKKASAEKEHLVVTFEHKPVASSDLIHVFVDDRFMKAVGGRNMISVDLEPGNHTIDLRDATRDHEVRGGCKRVRVTISDTEASKPLSPEGGEECKP